MIIWIVMSNSRTRSVTNFFLMNLAVADVLKATLDMPVLYVFILTQNWTWGSVTCKVVRFVGNMTAAASILSLIAVTIDRYRAIVYPFLPRLGKRMVSFGIYMIWSMAAIWACPNLIFGQVRSGGTNSTWTCILVWPDNAGDGVYGPYDFG
ncbi:Tachykinin-like peptides receptor 86C [Holothuria leucospilota]|uniref:Tachykinin-like peptides receptor 86C n=1 Tax=Holothuria leucospilota TaxID=206669 RepID=A0A9Q0YHG7_HOLLE|nr:Tachykinin-like peptides receptor 86C [Holothuria leucospilota]